MKFLILLTFTIRADEDDYDEDEYSDPRLFASAMQLNNNNVGDIHNVKGN